MQNDEKQPTVASPIEPVVGGDLAEISEAIYGYVMGAGMAKHIVKAGIVPCMKGHKTASVSYVRCELENLLKAKSR